MTDRELLEMAAKAAGFKYTLHHHGGSDYSLAIDDVYWYPLHDDGDALRLAVKCNITIGFESLPDGPIVYATAEWCDDWDQGFRLMEWLNKDAAAATRRAIVRAAAEIGKAMP